MPDRRSPIAEVEGQTDAMEPVNENPTATRPRHGCVTAYFIFMILGNTLSALLYFFAGDWISAYLPKPVPVTMFLLLGILALANVLFGVLLVRWKKVGFYGFILSSLVTLLINLFMGLGIGQSLFGITGIVILYAVLQIKAGKTSAWEELE